MGDNLILLSRFIIQNPQVSSFSSLGLEMTLVNKQIFVMQTDPETLNWGRPSTTGYLDALER